MTCCGRRNSYYGTITLTTGAANAAYGKTRFGMRHSVPALRRSGITTGRQTDCPLFGNMRPRWGAMRTAREIRVSGLVQGVGFRWTAKRIADRLGVDGWVRNNPDGTVSLEVEGTETQIREFLESLDDAMGSYIQKLDSSVVAAGKIRDGFDVVR